MPRSLAVLALAAAALAQEVRPGALHPDFDLPRIDGGFGKLSDFRGKKVLLFHFASW